jgi:hypothetical protein
VRAAHVQFTIRSLMIAIAVIGCLLATISVIIGSNDNVTLNAGAFPGVALSGGLGINSRVGTRPQRGNGVVCGPCRIMIS